MVAAETVVRMGELAASEAGGDVLVTIGLGSCIGLVLVDAARGIAGLAHVMLPAVPAGGDAQPAKYADTAVPALVASVLGLGARRMRLEAVLVGGAQMFSFGGGSLDVGARNAAAVTEAVGRERVPVRAAATGGSSGRTVRVAVATGAVSVRAAGQPEAVLFSPALARR